MKKNIWDIIIKVIIAVAGVLAGSAGSQILI